MYYNTRVINEAFKEAERQWNGIVFDKLDEFCRNLLLDAVIENRRGNPNAHQFTGNLINSIVVLLYSHYEGVLSKYFAYDRLQAPIRKEMSAMTSRKTQRKYAVHFRPDWQGTPHSIYTPEVATDGSTGPQDATQFANSWSPTTKKGFEICVAYTSEYADWVEMHHHSTGFMNSVSYARKVLVTFGLKKV